MTPIKHHLQLISLHIPKTAGTSFRNTLKAVYGEEQVIRLDIDLIHHQLRIEQQPFDQPKLPRKVKVVHGHFSPALLRQKLALSPKTPMITWLRHPVDRVISNYFYLAKRLKEELNEEGKGLNILSKMQKTLLEYAYAELNRNRMSKFLTGITLEECLFVGISEHYESDLEYLSRLLKWKSYSTFHHNATGGSLVVSEVERAAIRAWNAEDVNLYEHALRLRERRS